MEEWIQLRTIKWVSNVMIFFYEFHAIKSIQTFILVKSVKSDHFKFIHQGTHASWSERLSPFLEFETQYISFLQNIFRHCCLAKRGWHKSLA